MKKLGIILAILSIGLFCYSQQDSFTQRISKQFREFKTSHQSEKVYLHLDRPYYKPGDDIWFTAYLVNANTNRPSQISEVVYVDLIDENGKVEENLFLSTTEGKARGDFQISGLADGSSYFIRAYTNWMKNEGEESFFYKEIPIQKITESKIIIHTKYDKDYYLPGEKVTGKLWITDNDLNPLRAQAYSIDVTNAKSTIYSNSDSTELTGLTNISFVLPEKTDSNQVDLNLSLELDGEKQLISSKVPVSQGIIDLQFFPEGGDLINNVKSKVAFKAINELGRSVEVEGVIKDGNGNTVTDFSSYHKGMGAFILTPDLNKNYKVVITQPLGVKQTYSLPEIKSIGYRLAVDNGPKNDSLIVSIHAPAENTIYLIGQQKENVCFKEEIKVKANENKVSVPIGSLPIGIYKLTLFDENEIETCERLVFINKHKQLKVKITTDKDSYAAREKVEMLIRTYDLNGHPVPANLSLSVHEKGDMQFSENILSYLHMSSELKGNIEDPSWYFSNEAKTDTALDYVMLTHGWRRFTYQQIAKNNSNKFFAERANTISGTVTNKRGKPIKNPTVFVQYSKTKITTPVKGDENGRFTYNGWDGVSKINFFAENWYSYGNNWQITVDDDNRSNLVNTNYVNKMYEGSLSETKKGNNVFADMIKNNQEDAVEILNISLEQAIEDIGGVIITGYKSTDIKNKVEAIDVISTDDINKFPAPDFQSAIQGKSTSVSITRNSGAPGSKYTFVIRGVGSVNNTEPLFIVDGVPTIDAPNIVPEDISSVTILKDASACALYGNRGANGVVLISTKRGDFSNSNYEEDSDTKNYLNENDAKIFDNVREFYSPNYKEDVVSIGMDNRVTLFYEPEIRTNDKGIAKISFYTSDNTSAFNTNVEGLNKNGLVGAQQFEFTTVK